MTQYVVLSVDSPRDLPARIVDTDADVTMSLGKKSAIESLQMIRDHDMSDDQHFSCMNNSHS